MTHEEKIQYDRNWRLNNPDYWKRWYNKIMKNERKKTIKM